MSVPPPSGPKHPPSSLPPRPPVASGSQSASFKPAYSSAPSYSSPGSGSGYGSKPPSRAPSTGYNAFTAFQPRAVASTQQYRTSSPVVSGPPYTETTAGLPPAYSNSQPSYQSAPSYYGQSSYADASYGQSPVPQIANPFPLPGQEQSRKGYGRDSGMDPEMEAQIAQWQSAYMSRESDPAAPLKAPGRTGPAAATGANTVVSSTVSSHNPSASNAPTPGTGNDAAAKTVARSGGGQTWTDSTLLEWDPAHFRLFVGNLAGEVTDDSLKKAFARYPSLQKARVIRDKRTEKSKGYGFVSFSDGDDYFKAAREMQGKYIGSHPVLLRRAVTEVRPVTADKKGRKAGHGGRGGGHGSVGGGKPKGDGVKKVGKTKGGLKILG